MSAEPEAYAIPRLSLTERDGRWGRVREQMAARGLDCLLAYGPGNLSAQYLTHVDLDGLAVFPVDRDPLFLVGSGERWLHWAQRSQDWVQDVRPAANLSRALGDAMDALAPQRVGLVGFRGVPFGTYQDLMTCLSDYQTEDASQLVAELRLVKSAEEIAMMQRAGEIAEEAIDAIVESAAAGRDEKGLHGRGMGALLGRGCEPASHISVEASPRPFHPVRLPSTRSVQRGDVVVAHINPRYGGYYGHPHVCISVGEPRPEIREMFKVCEEAFETFKAEARPGRSLGDVCRKVLDGIERAGFDWAKEPVTHSIGLMQQEPPVGGVRPSPYPDFELKENQVFGLHPWVGHIADEIGIDSGRSVVITKDSAQPVGTRKHVELFVV